MASRGGRKPSSARDRRSRQMRRVPKQSCPSHIQPDTVNSSDVSNPTLLACASRASSSAYSGLTAEDSILLSSGGDSSSESSQSAPSKSNLTSRANLKKPESDSDSDDDYIEYFENEHEKRQGKNSNAEKLKVFKESLEDIAELQVLMKNRLNKNASGKDSSSFAKEMIMRCASDIASHREEFLKKAQENDKHSQGDLVTRVDGILPISLPKKFNKVDAVGMLVDFWWLYREMEVLSPRYSRECEKDKTDYVAMLQRTEMFVREDIKQVAISNKLLKSVSVSKVESDRLFKQDGGFLSQNKKLRNCPKCGHCFVDEPPSNKDVKKKNNQLTAEFQRQGKVLHDFELGISDVFPVDKKTGKQLHEIKAPTFGALLGHCHCVQLHASLNNPSHKCPWECKDPKTKKQFNRGDCPLCNCTCSFIYQLKNHDAVVTAVLTEKKNQTTVTPGRRAAASNFLVQAATAGSMMRDNAMSSLERQRKDGSLQTTDDEILRYAKNQGCHAQALWITNNPPSLEAHQLLSREIRLAQHPNGPVFTNLHGHEDRPTSMRNFKSSTATNQRARNSGLHNMDALLEEGETSTAAASDRQASRSLVVAPTSSTPNPFITPNYGRQTTITMPSNLPFAPSLPNNTPSEVVRARACAFKTIQKTKDMTPAVRKKYLKLAKALSKKDKDPFLVNGIKECGAENSPALCEMGMDLMDTDSD